MGHFLALLRLQANPPEPKSGSYCTIAFNQAVSCWLCTIAETVGLSPAATPGAPYSMDRETGNQGTTTQSPTRFSTAPLISTITWIHNPLSYCQTPGSMAGRRSCFAKQRRAAVAFHTIVRRRTRCIPTSDQALCPVGIPRRKAASKADSAPPMSHPMQQKRPSRRFKNIECTQ